MTYNKTLNIYSNFNCETLSRLLENSKKHLINTENFSMQDINFSILNSTKTQNNAFLWLIPSSVSPSFKKVEQFFEIDHKVILDEVESFCNIIIKNKDKFSNVLITPIINPFPNVGYGLLDKKENLGISNLLAKMNLTLERKLSLYTNIYLLDSEDWTKQEKIFDPRLWYYTKNPFTNEVCKSLCLCIQKTTLLLNQDTKKLVIFDLDDTIWGGTVGELGWEKLNIGGHNAEGEAFLDFQKSLKALARKGVILAVASKNEEKTALNAIDEHPEMIIKKSDLATWEINWNDKANNIIEISKKLNLTTSSIVFLDDSPSERARVKEAIPDILVPVLPENILERPAFLKSLTCFDKNEITYEDRIRNETYVKKRKFNESKSLNLDLKSWLKSLNITIDASPLKKESHNRAVQLLNKTNQFNLLTRRLSIEQILQWCQDENNNLFVFNVSDRIGDYGLTAIISSSINDNVATITDFVISCRIAGKDIEKAMIYFITRFLKNKNIELINFNFLQTSKNKPMYDILLQTDLTLKSNCQFIWDLSKKYPKPDTIKFL